MKRYFFALTIAVTLSLTACSNSDNGINITVEPSDSSHGGTISYTEEAPPTFSTEPVTFDGYSLTPEGGSVPVRLTMEVENVQEGEAAWKQMASQGAQLPAPEQGKEYILVNVKVTYEDGDLETLYFVENYPASWAAARVHFLIPCENSNSFIKDVTRQLPNCIRRCLDMKQAVLTMDFCLRSGEKNLKVEYQRFLPKEQPALILQRLRLIPRSEEHTSELQSR